MNELKNEKEQRQYARIEIPVQLRPTEVFGKEGRVKNISLGGVRIFGTKKVDVGTTLNIDFALPSREWMTAGVRVVWARERDTDSLLKYDIGCWFTEIPLDSQKILLNHLTEILPEKKENIT